ncbi:hypothetical protein EVAR_25964_1 [Eumeta japonica]|uniref:Uncharacterized protein n=1 Tax=Eumeta variegata TaxID=151549 RepID=A0A4C1V3E4_EUMVA|nr:hypothetical protein EVAR_25964_1 [Eumeta japonica]
MCNQPPKPARVPKDGPGPRGAPDCYYMSRQLNSTFRYANFVKKLRAEEEKELVAKKIRLQESQDMWRRELFKSSDRKLRDLFKKEEEENIKKFVEQSQAGVELVWRDKMNRLDYLLEKRKKEQEEKYKDTPLSKCAHVLTDIYKMRCKEAQEIQLYQVKEREMKKMAEKEFEKMWHEVALKESEALARFFLIAFRKLKQNRCRVTKHRQAFSRGGDTSLLTPHRQPSGSPQKPPLPTPPKPFYFRLMGLDPKPSPLAQRQAGAAYDSRLHCGSNVRDRQLRVLSEACGLI